MDVERKNNLQIHTAAAGAAAAVAAAVMSCIDEVKHAHDHALAESVSALILLSCP